jgi:hypothetical protein
MGPTSTAAPERRRAGNYVTRAASGGRPAAAKLHSVSKIFRMVMGVRRRASGGRTTTLVRGPPGPTHEKSARPSVRLGLRAEWTNTDPRITEALAAFNRSAVPFDLIYAPGRDAPEVLPELLTPDLVLDALAKTTSNK